MIHYDTDTYSVLIDPDSLELYVDIKLPNGEAVTTIQNTFPNLKILSAHLRCEVGYKEAVNILYANNVAKDSPLWDLNGDNPHK